MNIGASTRIALAQHNLSRNWLAGMLEVHPSRASQICNRETCDTRTLVKLAKAFNMPVSRFVALGEDAPADLLPLGD